MKRVQDNVWSVKGSKKSNFDFYSVLKPAMYFGYVTGTFVLTLKGRIGARKYSTSYVAIIYGAVLFSVIIGGTISSILQDDNRSLHLTKLNTVITTCQAIFNILRLGSTVAIFSSLVLGKEKLATVLDDIRNNDKILGQIGIRIDYAKESKWSYVRMGIYASSVFMSFFVHFCLSPEISYELFILWLIYPCLESYTSACKYIFIDVIYLLKERFRLLNEQVIKLTQKAKGSHPETVITSYGISAKVRSISVAHRNLCRSAMELNRIFNLPIVGTVLYQFTTVLLSCYVGYVEVYYTPGGYLKSFLWINYGTRNGIQIILLVAVCTLAKNQAASTGQLIHELKVSEFDSVLNDTIQLFSLQLHHDKIEFSGLGLFPLDATLIQSIVGTVTTYLIILVQFDSATRNVKTPCEEAANDLQMYAKMQRSRKGYFSWGIINSIDIALVVIVCDMVQNYAGRVYFQEFNRLL